MKNPSIEIHVKDTISIIADHFEYRLSVDKNNDTENDDLMQQEVLDQILNKYGDKKRSFTEQVQTEISNNNFYVLKLNDISEIEKLATEVAKLRTVEITLQSRTYSKEEEVDRLLIEKLLKKARKRAKYLSKLLKKPLAGIVAVVDKPMVEKPVRDIKQGEGGWKVYPPLSAMPQLLAILSRQDIVFEKEMVVSFRLKD